MIKNIYELNTRIWLNDLSNKYQRQIILANIPDEEILNIKELGFDCLWLMGIWSRSKESRDLVLKDAQLMQELKTILPNLKLEDIASSPYAIATYEVDSFLGAWQDLSKFKKRLNKNKIKLILDFVPSHVALDHLWLKENPYYFIRGNEDDLKNHPDLFFKHQGTGYIFAYGKDPNFPAWHDVAQLNYFNFKTRKAMIEVLMDISPFCDGLRCDMAMLILKRTQREIWKERVFQGNIFKEPKSEFWEESIATVKKLYPEFLFIAEVYWGLEQELINLGFDYVYDKKFYDYLRDSNIARIKESLIEKQQTAVKKLKFIENHDEIRAVSAFGPEKLKVATFLLGISPSVHLFHQGQLEGFKIKVPISIIKSLGEKIDTETFSFYKKLLLTLKDISFDSSWKQTAVFPAWKENQTYKHFIVAFTKTQDNYYLAAANYSDLQSQCYAYFDITTFRTDDLVLKDLLGKNEYIRNKEEIMLKGLYLDMPKNSFHLFKILGKE